jgi:hypothetical protein
MIRHFFPMLLAGTMLFGPAQALVLAISPLVDQPSPDDPPESKTAPRVQSTPAAEPGGRELPANPYGPSRSSSCPARVNDRSFHPPAGRHRRQLSARQPSRFGWLLNPPVRRVRSLR